MKKLQSGIPKGTISITEKWYFNKGGALTKNKILSIKNSYGQEIPFRQIDEDSRFEIL